LAKCLRAAPSVSEGLVRYERLRRSRVERVLESNFANWRLRIGGLARQPLALSMPQLRNLPSRTQITQHLCDEGWTAIGQWTGVQVGRLIEMADLAPEARYVVFHCLDDVLNGGEYYYESLDLFDAFHPQTILAYDMNGGPLPVRHGAPLPEGGAAHRIQERQVRRPDRTR
jgi:DMSO/TMAO reductase YedYZ molybdopterin-dependent catalytic subunit